MQEQQPSVPSATGAFTRVVATMRSMPMLAIHENDLETTTLLNTQASVALGIAGTLVTFGLGLVASAIYEGILTPQAKIVAWFGAPLCGLLACGAIRAACWWNKKRGIILDRIRAETRPVMTGTFTPMPDSPNADTAGSH